MTDLNTAREISPITIADLSSLDGEPRVHDLRLAEALGFERPRIIRELIKRNLKEIETLGPSPCRAAMVQIGTGAQREVTEYHLNEAQALLICMFARTSRAAEVRKQVIEVFMAWRRGEARQPPAPQKAVKKSVNELSFLRETHGKIDLTFNKTKDKWKEMSQYETGRSMCAEVFEFAYDNGQDAHMLMTHIPSELMRRNMNEHARGFVSKMATYVIFFACLEKINRAGRKPNGK